MKKKLPNFDNRFTRPEDCCNSNGSIPSKNALKGNFTALFVLMLLGLSTLLGPLSVQAQGNDPSANLDQVRNGSGTSVTTPVYAWVNGNANATQAHYLEGHSIAYRMVVENLSPGAHYVIIEWDTKKDAKAAIDFLTSYDNIEPHMPPFDHTAEVFDPTLGYPASYAADSNRFRIPTPTFTLNSPSVLPAGAGAYPLVAFNGFWNSTPSLNKSFMTMYNAGAADGITSLVYTHLTDKDQLRINFSTANATVIFAWGGHIASKANWGTGNSAVFIPGSPYHTRLISVDGKGGNQDRSLQSAAVTSLDSPPCSVNGDAIVCSGGTGAYAATSDGTETGYTWHIVNIIKPVGGIDPTIVTNPSSGATVNAITVNSGEATSFRVEVTITKTGADPSTCGMDVQVEDLTADAQDDGDLTCDDGTVRVSASLMGSLSSETPTYEWSLDGTPIADSNVDHLDVTVGGTYSVTIRSNSTADGCDATAQVTVEDHTAKPEITITPSGTITCDPDTYTSLVASLTNIPSYIDQNMISYAWTKVGDATVLGTTDTYQATEAGTYRVTIEFDETGCVESADQIVTDDKTPPTAGAGGPYSIACEGTSVAISGTSDGTSYEWSVSPLGAGTFGDATMLNTTFSFNPGYTSATLRLTALSSNSCDAYDEATVTQEPCVGPKHCTLTQGAYGNANGKFCGDPLQRKRSQLITDLLSQANGGAVIVGIPNVRSVTLSTSACIIEKLPAGGPAIVLPAGLSTCSNMAASILDKKSKKFNNVLIGQIVTLTLNMRLDKYLFDNTLQGVELTASMTTIDGTDCSDHAEPILGTEMTWSIPSSILTYFSNNSMAPTVGNLLTLANQAIGGASGKPSLSDINAAVSAVNEMFDECRMLVEPVQIGTARVAGVAKAAANTTLKAYPNPFSDVATIEFSMPEKGNYSLDVFDVTGRKVATLGAGQAEAGNVYSFKIGQVRMPEGIYLVKLNAGKYSEMLKIILKR